MSQVPKQNKPSFWVDPDKAKFNDLYKYQSSDMNKINQSIKNYKGSVKYLGNILLPPRSPFSSKEIYYLFFSHINLLIDGVTRSVVPYKGASLFLPSKR